MLGTLLPLFPNINIGSVFFLSEYLFNQANFLFIHFILTHTHTQSTYFHSTLSSVNLILIALLISIDLQVIKTLFKFYTYNFRFVFHLVSREFSLSYPEQQLYLFCREFEETKEQKKYALEQTSFNFIKHS